jgi:hypothetical protein
MTEIRDLFKKEKRLEVYRTIIDSVFIWRSLEFNMMFHIKTR